MTIAFLIGALLLSILIGLAGEYLALRVLLRIITR
jgi:hypothetical protein